MKRILSLWVVCLILVSGGIPAWAESADTPSVVDAEDGVLRAGGVFSVVTYAAPEDMVLSSTGLKEAGLASGPIVLRSDEIRIFSSRDVMNSAPLARIWLNSREGGRYWFHTGGEGSAEDFVIPKGAVVVVWTRASQSSIAWTNVFSH
ncbi:MAG TPA: hypothetical protein PJ991_09925 [Kiritimatiellia bacterium]|nr:hypothetical protein [Kiritimatiellia bacterium]